MQSAGEITFFRGIVYLHSLCCGIGNQFDPFILQEFTGGLGYQQGTIRSTTYNKRAWVGLDHFGEIGRIERMTFMFRRIDCIMANYSPRLK